MTTLAKIEANRRNALLSTGPRTPAGKAVVAANATKHGIFARLPVVAGESPPDWDAHRAGVVASLAPVGLLEVNLAERAALLLWRLARLARYEAAVTTAAIEDAVLLPPDMDPADRALYPPAEREDRYLQSAEVNARVARRDHAEVRAAADLLRRLGEPAWPEPINRETAKALLDWAYGAAAVSPRRKFEPETYTDPGFHPASGPPGSGSGRCWRPRRCSRGRWITTPRRPASRRPSSGRTSRPSSTGGRPRWGAR
jgi:hypothetical protein